MKLKTFLALILVLVSTLALSACSAVVNGSQSQVAKVLLNAIDASTSATVTPSAAAQESLLAFQLAVGTLKLDGTNQAVTKAQAAALLPLWKTLKEDVALTAPSGKPNSDATPVVQNTPQDLSTSQNLINGQVSLILGAMTAAQIRDITNLNLTQNNLNTALKDLGITLQQPGGNGQDQSGTPSASITRIPWPTPLPGVTVTPPPTPAGSSNQPDGGGNKPGFGGGAPGNGKPSGQVSGGSQPGGQSGNGQQASGSMNQSGDGFSGEHGHFIPIEVIDAVIQYLEKLTA